MSAVGFEYLLSAIYVVSTIKSAVGAVQYANSWYTWLPGDSETAPIPPDHKSWQWVENDDEFEIER